VLYKCVGLYIGIQYICVNEEDKVGKFIHEVADALYETIRVVIKTRDFIHHHINFEPFNIVIHVNYFHDYLF
jgi:hypothetical protein